MNVWDFCKGSVVSLVYFIAVCQRIVQFCQAKFNFIIADSGRPITTVNPEVENVNAIRHCLCRIVVDLILENKLREIQL